MRLSAPKKNVWWIALILSVLGLIGHLVALPVITMYSFWLVLAGYVLLLLGTSMKGF
jgi:hypothetical protein